MDYEKQILLDLIHEDGLLVLAKGLGIERILLNLIKSYCDEGNLILILGTSSKEEEFILSQCSANDIKPSPRCVTAECSISERSQIYYNGGVLFVTSRILVVDLLLDRIPAHLITGIIMWNAHKILESCQEAFILRLYRQKNKTGFIKALSSSPVSFTAGFCHVERVMKNLFVKRLYLWPRFHADIKAAFENAKPEVIELHLKMTDAMLQIQTAIMDIVTITVQELKLSNRMIDNDELSPENAISNSFDKLVKIILEPVWHQLSVRTKQLIADLKVLRTLLISLRNTEKVIQSAGWVLLGAAETLFLYAKARVFGTSCTTNTAKKLKLIDDKESEISTLDKIDFKFEINPKWLALSEALDEIRQDTKDSSSLEKCVIVAKDDRTIQQLKGYLIDGSDCILKHVFDRTFGAKFGITLSCNGKNSSEKPTTKSEDNNDKDITLTQISKKYDYIGQEKAAESDDTIENKDRSLLCPLIILHPLKNYSEPFGLTSVLHDIQPRYIIMYDYDLAFIRQIEVWQADQAHHRVKVYFLLYKGTVEEQLYLTSLKKEKDAFEYLIQEKSSMAVFEDAEGRTADHSYLQRDPRKPSEMVEGSANTREGGSQSEQAVLQKIIVDMREFRSELPALIHKRGIDIIPITLEVGDYILTPDICVERKSLSDLIGSLNSGRLYNQAQGMTQHYKKPILLIEFDHNKPFYLQGKYYLSSDSSSKTKDITAKLQLLTLHFPRLRIMWCPSPYATAEVFQMLKEGKSDPEESKVRSLGFDVNPEIDIGKFNPQVKAFLLKLPGVTTKNISGLLKRVKDIPELLTLSVDELSDILGHSQDAASLYSALHTSIKATDISDDVTNKRKSNLTKKGTRRFRRL